MLRSATTSTIRHLHRFKVTCTTKAITPLFTMSTSTAVETPKSRTQIIHDTLTEQFSPTSLVIVDESYKHRGHAAMKGLNPSETHYHVEIVSSVFEGKKLLERHRMVNQALHEEFSRGLHALSLKTKTPNEVASPNPSSE